MPRLLIFFSDTSILISGGFSSKIIVGKLRLQPPAHDRRAEGANSTARGRARAGNWVGLPPSRHGGPEV
jgi:hypothetical protein